MAEGERGGVVPWDGRPPKEHEAAPAHLLRDRYGASRVTIFTHAFGGDDWVMDGNFFSPEMFVRRQMAYVAPLYPPAAAQDAEGVLLTALEENCWDLRCENSPTPGGDDGDVVWVVISHHMAKPCEREVAWAMSPAAAIRSALAGAGDREGAK